MGEAGDGVSKRGVGVEEAACQGRRVCLKPLLGARRVSVTVRIDAPAVHGQHVHEAVDCRLSTARGPRVQPEGRRPSENEPSGRPRGPSRRLTE